jgi:hypothetical protein
MLVLLLSLAACGLRRASGDFARIHRNGHSSHSYRDTFAWRCRYHCAWRGNSNRRDILARR